MADNIEKAIEEVQSRLDIAEVISSYIQLRKSGANFKANCPFHQEKTASFMVSPTKQIYHCFGCGVGGDMISFVMKYERLEFMEALKVLAEKANVQLPHFRGGASGYKRSLSRVLYKVNEFAASYYNALLIGSRKADEAREYLAQRSLNAATVAKFKLGYASAAWDDFLKFAAEKKVSMSILEKAGLILPGREDSFYDRFRNRVIFPIFDVRSNIVAFGGRALDDSPPKYMNSPETDVYVKGKHLYGLNFSLEQIKQKDYVIIVEGYFDLIIPYQHGIDNIVATLGTALTLEQIRLIKRFTTNVIILFDPDEAGEAASLRGLDLLISEGLSVKIATLPKGFDPDSYIRKNSAESFLALVDKADNLFSYKLSLLLKKYNPAEPEEKAKITTEMLPTLKRVENRVLRDDYIKRLSEALFVKEEALLEELAKVKIDYSYPVERQFTKKGLNIRPAEKAIVGLMMESLDFAQEEARRQLDLSDFENENARLIVKAVYAMLDKKQRPTATKVIRSFNDDNMSCVISEAISEAEKLGSEYMEKGRDCIRRMKEDNLRSKQKRVIGLIEEAGKKGDDEKVLYLIREQNRLNKELTGLRNARA